MIMVAVLSVCMLFFPTQSYEVTLAVDLEHIMSKSELLSEIHCIINRNIQNVAPCSGLANKSTYISPVGQYFRDTSPLSIRSFIKNHRTWIFFVCFVLDSSPLFSMGIALMLSWWISISSTKYSCPSMKYLDQRHCGKVLSAPTILNSVELFPFNNLPF